MRATRQRSVDGEILKITIYNEPSRGSLGGSEVSAAVLAAGLAVKHEVEIVHYRPTMARESLADFAAVDLSRVKLRLGPPQVAYRGVFWKVRERLRAERAQEAAIAGACDLLIAFVHEPPPFCGAPKGILWILFPFHALEEFAWPKRPWHRWKVRARLQTYDCKLAISEFSKKWTAKRWGVDSEVVYPPVAVRADENVGKKEKLILSVGRFAAEGHGKKQREMLDAFGELKTAGKMDWSFVMAGACPSTGTDVDFLKALEPIAARQGAHLAVNVARQALTEMYQRAAIFWHATGMGIDEEQRPELAEHFGISTVEAMAAGCVPVVIQRGGQKEIVEHGVSGFLWETPEELVSYSRRLLEDESLRAQMSVAARARAQRFSREAFVARFTKLVEG